MSALSAATPAAPPALTDPDRRFGSIARLYGATAIEHLAAAHVVVVGVGGVGSWAAEALARSGIGRLSLIDLDQVAESNINRQAQALDSTLGMAKVDALAARIHDINPLCQVQRVEDFVTPDNVGIMIPRDANCVLDCCDQVRAKAALAAHCNAQGIAVVLSGAAGGKRLPQQVQLLDLADVRNDPLLAKVRYQLRRHHGAARVGPMHVRCVCSPEPVRQPTACAGAPQGLNCAGYGSSVMVTATFGLVAAAAAIEILATPREGLL